MDKKTVKRKYRFIIGVIACFTLVFFAGLGFSLKQQNTYDKQNEVSENLITTQPKVNVPKLYNTMVKDDAGKTTAKPEQSAEQKEEAPDAQDVFVPKEPDRYIFPIDGSVTAAYSEQPVYSKTLEDWRAHTGIDLAADEGAKIVAAAAGTVSDVYSDALFGYTVIIKHTGGTQSLYANLSGDVTVAPGQNVKEGELIGYAGSTAACEIEEPPHIHFELSRDGKHLNPGEYLVKK